MAARRRQINRDVAARAGENQPLHRTSAAAAIVEAPVIGAMLSDPQGIPHVLIITGALPESVFAFFAGSDLLATVSKEMPDSDVPAEVRKLPTEAESATWRERLWTAPAETRIGTYEVAEALGRPVSWIYRHTSRKSGYALLPVRKLDGELVFVVGEIRAWIRDHEEVIRARRMDSTPQERGLRAVPKAS